MAEKQDKRRRDGRKAKLDEIDTQIERRRNDPEFMERLKRRMREDAEVLRQLAE